MQATYNSSILENASLVAIWLGPCASSYRPLRDKEVIVESSYYKDTILRQKGHQILLLWVNGKASLVRDDEYQDIGLQKFLAMPQPFKGWRGLHDIIMKYSGYAAADGLLITGADVAPLRSSSI